MALLADKNKKTASKELNALQKNVSMELLEKYTTTGPRYTSYPTAPVWTEKYT